MGQKALKGAERPKIVLKLEQLGLPFIVEAQEIDSLTHALAESLDECA